MYEHLLTTMRHCANPNTTCEDCIYGPDCLNYLDESGYYETGAEMLLDKAADVIEELRAKYDKALTDLVKAQKAADVVEVVRCKDCIHRPEATGPTSGMEVNAPRDADGWPDETCPYLCEDLWYNVMPQDDWFCHRGERRSSESASKLEGKTK